MQTSFQLLQCPSSVFSITAFSERPWGLHSYFLNHGWKVELVTYMLCSRVLKGVGEQNRTYKNLCFLLFFFCYLSLFPLTLRYTQSVTQTALWQMLVLCSVCYPRLIQGWIHFAAIRCLSMGQEYEQSSARRASKEHNSTDEVCRREMHSNIVNSVKINGRKLG